MDWHGEVLNYHARNPAWRKWRPKDGTNARWYDYEHFERLLAACIAKDRKSGNKRTVRDFVGEFDGLTTSAKQTLVLDAVGVKRVPLSALATEDGVDAEMAGRLLDAMKRYSRPVKPVRLGVIGKDHLRAALEGMGCDPNSIHYHRLAEVTDGVPWVQETAFGFQPGAGGRRLITGVNWSPGIHNLFRVLGQFGPTLDDVLTDLKVGVDEPVVFVLHIANPRAQFTDRGKSIVVVGGNLEPEDEQADEGEFDHQQFEEG